MKILRNLDEADLLIRARTPFHSRVRDYDRYGNHGPFVSLSGTVPCSSTRGCVDIERGPTERHPDIPSGSVKICHSCGNLPVAYDQFRQAHVDFVVRSFATPIAWHIDAPNWRSRKQVDAWLRGEHPGMWIIPNVSYSPTTGQHQHQVTWALRGHWRMPEGTKPKPLPVKSLTLKSAPTRVRSGGDS